MGGGSKPRGPSPEEREAQRLQNERLKEERRLAKEQEAANNALRKARRAGGGAGGLILGDEEGSTKGYKSLLGD